MSGYRELYKKIKVSSSQSLITDYIFRKVRATQNENEVCENQWPLPQISIAETVSSDDEGQPYLGKPSDMWALGVVLFTMLYGQFPFYDSAPQELFRKIKAAEYTIPSTDGRVSENSNEIIKKLLVLNPTKRMTADQVLDALRSILADWHLSMSIENDFQIVPEYTALEESEKEDKKSNSMSLCLDTSFMFDAVVVGLKPGKTSSGTEKIINNVDPQGNQFGISHINEDEQNLTAADIQKYQHLIPRPSSP
ncbi:hypothetical protein TNCV_3079021 [Trichonephila clavipes]|nr:hypothetical protein TNCV_3079021 [Trichonephila clavipes]